jgi:hypothetical protein
MLLDCSFNLDKQKMEQSSDCCPTCQTSETDSDNRPISISIVNSADTNSKNQNSAPNYPPQRPVVIRQQQPVVIRQQRPAVIRQQPVLVRQRPALVQPQIIERIRYVDRPVQVIKEVPVEVETVKEVVREIPYDHCKTKNYAAFY